MRQKKKNSDVKIGEHIVDQLPQIDFGRIAVQTAKQVIVQKVKEAERSMQFELFKDKIGEIVNGIVKRVEYGNIVVDLGRAEALLKREELLNRETYRRSDRVRAYNNLQRKCFSVQDYKTGLVIEHTNKLCFTNAMFVVRKSGNERVKKEGRKHVHAFVNGIRNCLLYTSDAADE